MTSSTTSDGANEPVCCVQMHRLGKNMRPRKKKLNDMCCKQKPTRMVVRNRVTLDIEHRSTKNKCGTRHKKRNRRARTQMWFTNRHIMCCYLPHRKDRCKTAFTPPLTYNRSTRHTAQNTFSNSYKERVCQILCALRQHVS